MATHRGLIHGLVSFRYLGAMWMKNPTTFSFKDFWTNFESFALADANHAFLLAKCCAWMLRILLRILSSLHLPKQITVGFFFIIDFFVISSLLWTGRFTLYVTVGVSSSHRTQMVLVRAGTHKRTPWPQRLRGCTNQALLFFTINILTKCFVWVTALWRLFIFKFESNRKKNIPQFSSLKNTKLRSTRLHWD